MSASGCTPWRRWRTRSASARPGECRGQSTISVGGALYSVPSTLTDERVWARVEGSELVVVHADSPQGTREVARHELTTPGQPRISDEHYRRGRRARSADEAAFLALRPSGEAWLVKAAAPGTSRVRRKLAEAVDLAKLHRKAEVEQASWRSARRRAASRTATWPRSSPTRPAPR